MDIEVWSVGKAKFAAGTEFQEPMIREALDTGGDVAATLIDCTDSERSDISYDEYARVTGNVPGLILFEGWLTGDRDAPPPADEAIRLREALADAEYQSGRWVAEAASQERRVDALRGLLAEILADLKARNVGHRVAGQMPNGWGADEYQVALWRERAEQAGVWLP
jgi:hypothetical protein